MLLCITAYSKDNGQVIEKIKSLDDSDQRDIMFYIQKTLASINSNAIASGEMTSGLCICSKERKRIMSREVGGGERGGEGGGEREREGGRG